MFLKEMVRALAVHLSSYGCTWEVGRALEYVHNTIDPRQARTISLFEVRYFNTFFLDN